MLLHLVTVFSLVFVLVPYAVRCHPPRFIDMTYSFDESSLGYPIMKKFQLNVTANGTFEGKFWYQSEEFSMATHIGTHMDAPCHLAEGRWCADEVPPPLLFAPAAVIDITAKAVKNADVLLSVKDLKKWERKTGESLHGTIVLLRTGWGSRYPDMDSYSGKDSQGKFHFPGVSKQAAQWLVDNREIRGVGTECLSLDNGQSTEFWANRILLGDNIYGLVNMANMDELPIEGAWLAVLPMKIKKASGAPVRIIATFWDDDGYDD